MKLSEHSVKRNWRYIRGRGMEFTMQVDLGGETIHAAYLIPDNDFSQRTLPHEIIEQELQHRIRQFIMGTLFPRQS